MTIVDSTGALVTSFSYDDQEPWPLSPDGLGPSLVIIDENGDLDPNDGTNWRASATSGGSPGTADAAGQSFADWMTANGLADPDAEYGGSGLSNLLAYALGRDLAPDVAPVINDAGGFASFSYRRRIGSGSLTYAVESSTDLATWIPANDLEIDGAPSPNGDGTETVNLLSDLPTADRDDTYYRLRVTVP